MPNTCPATQEENCQTAVDGRLCAGVTCKEQSKVCDELKTPCFHHCSETPTPKYPTQQEHNLVSDDHHLSEAFKSQQAESESSVSRHNAVSCGKISINNNNSPDSKVCNILQTTTQVSNNSFNNTISSSLSSLSTTSSVTTTAATDHRAAEPSASASDNIPARRRTSSRPSLPYNSGNYVGNVMPPPPISPSSTSATDRDEEMAGFVLRMRLQQEQNGVCDATTKNESGNHHCPILWRTRSLNAPSPIQQFGPCGRIMRNSAMVMTIQDPASQRLTWYKPPLSVLVIKKVRDALVIPPFLQLVTWLTQEKRMVVFVESSVLDDRLVTGHAMFPAVSDKLMSFRETHDDLTDKIDFIICLGGDGTLLYASSLFQQSVPPVMAFHLGSLGFLTPFKFHNYQEQVTNVLEGHAALTLRSRLRCIILRRGQEKQLPPSNHHQPPIYTRQQLVDDKSSSPAAGGAEAAAGLKAPTNLLVLNEVVIDRGPSPYLSNLDLYLDGKRITSVQGDGLIVSTPTGSTAYAVAAGASMIHPSVPAIMVTPICPHSLSFRPIVVPAGVELKITVSKDSRNTAWVSFDGRMRQELKHEDSLRVTTSIYPVPSICAEDQIADWFASLDECLRWNDRKRQRHLDDISPPDDGAANHSESSSPTSSLPTTPTTTTAPPMTAALEKEGGGDGGGGGGLQSVLEKHETEEEEDLEQEA